MSFNRMLMTANPRRPRRVVVRKALASPQLRLGRLASAEKRCSVLTVLAAYCAHAQWDPHAPGPDVIAMTLVAWLRRWHVSAAEGFCHDITPTPVVS
jgi:hypothetical protein